MHILITSDPLLADAHFTSSGLFSLVFMSSLFPFFLYFWIFKPCNTVGCLPSFGNFTHSCVATTLGSVLWKYCQGIYSITPSYIVSSMIWLKNTLHLSISRCSSQTGYFAWSLFPLSTVSFMTWVWNLCFVDLLCCFNDFPSYWPAACLEKRESLTRPSHPRWSL